MPVWRESSGREGFYRLPAVDRRHWMAAGPMTDTHTIDAFHRGRFHVMQPKGGGHRSGVDAMLYNEIRNDVMTAVMVNRLT